MQAHFSHLPLPNVDFLTDTKSVLDQCIRVIQAMIDIAAEQGWLTTTLTLQQLLQCLIQARWQDDPLVLGLPYVEEYTVPLFNKIKTGYPVLTLPGLKEKCLKNYELLAKPLREEFDEPEIEQIYKVLCEMPTINIEISIRGDYLGQSDVNRILPQPTNRNNWLEVHANQEYTLNVNLHRLGVRPSNTIYCPKFARGKDEGWFLTLGCQSNGELIALKRIASRTNRSSQQLTFSTPKKTGRILYTVYFMSDGYIGFDQQYDVQLDVIQPNQNNSFDDKY